VLTHATWQRVPLIFILNYTNYKIVSDEQYQSLILNILLTVHRDIFAQ